ncbi:hypothetical protein [Maribacter sp. ACAM166]|uniref:hypothetical protein n=1 Tax=Maribacter sp. ACAM166 TaxID=2508996 RepID=UPI0010FD1992|nr:hypothetical protein [Maribacter sp. ACAM166]TLP74278.1 hypothetical protein ES765_16430 [Maribacter sp. ACAM166]
MLSTSCSSGDDSKETEITLINKTSGNWTDNFGNSYTITGKSINIENKNIYKILTDGSNFIICKNGSNKASSANLYSKFVFTNISSNKLNYCQSFFDSPSQVFIENKVEPSVFNNLEAGCGGFLWSTMIRD